MSAIWVQDKKSVTTAQYEDFYKFIANAYDKPKYTLHFRADAPIDLKCLFFVPSFHTEKFGMGRMEAGVNLYSRKILIENKPKDLLPEWLRFVKGVVDSEDLPLSLSREKPQDSNLLKRIRDVLTRKLIRFLDEQARDDPVKYKEFYIEYNYFLKEGVCHDYKFMDQISKLLYFESSALDGGTLTSFDEYLSRCPPEQKAIYYLVAPSREVGVTLFCVFLFEDFVLILNFPFALPCIPHSSSNLCSSLQPILHFPSDGTQAALASPYYETFRKHKKEVLLLYSSIDDFVMSNIKTFSGRALTSAETSSIDLGEVPTDEADKDTDKEKEVKSSTLSDAQCDDLCAWFRLKLGEKKVRTVKTTKRFVYCCRIAASNKYSSFLLTYY